MKNGSGGVGGPMQAPAFPARLLAAGAAVVLLADVPLFASPFTRGDVLRAAALPFLASAAAVLALLLPGRDGPRPRAWLLLALPLLVVVPAALAAVEPEAAGLLRSGGTWLALVALALGLARVWRSAEDAAAAGRLLAWAGAVAGTWTLLDALVRWAPGVGPFGREGVAGPVLAALLPLALTQPRGRGVWRWLPAVLVTVGAVATLSRTGLVALGVTAPVTVALAVGPPRRRRAVALTLGGVLLLAALGFVAARLVKAPTGGTTLAVRAGLWRAAGRLVGERPLAGHGLGSFPAEVLRVRDPEEAALSRGRRPRVAHNDVLHAAAEGGVGAGLAMIAWLAGLAWVGARARRAAATEATRAEGAGWLGALLALAVASLGEDVFLDPAAVVLAASAGAALVVLGPAGRGRAPRALVATLLPLALLALAAAGVRTRDALADAQVRRYRDAIRDGVDPLEATTAAQDFLREGALRWRPEHPEAWYRLGVHRAELGSYAPAREAWRKALAADAGMTEAWLDTARSYLDEDRREDARAALLEARRRDPTRYDVHMRLGHLALGDEPVPGEPSDPEGFDPVAAHRHYNDAERVGGDRFETWVARARIERRLGHLETAGDMLRRADERRAKAPEILLESFRLAEAEGASDVASIGILALAVAADPNLARLVQREAERFLDEGRLREERAKAAVRGTLTPPDYTSAERAFEAAARRWAALMQAGAVAPGHLIAAADRDAEAQGYRAALSRLLAVMTWAHADEPQLGATREERLRALAEIQLRAARVATRIDAAQALAYFARAHATEGAWFLARGEWDAARRILAKAADEAPTSAPIHLAWAEALVKSQALDEAERALLKALELDRALAAAVKQRAVFEPLLVRPAVANALR